MVWPNDSLVQTCELREMAFTDFGGDLAKRLLGADSALAPKSLLGRSPSKLWKAFKVLKWYLKCVLNCISFKGVIWPKDSLVFSKEFKLS